MIGQNTSQNKISQSVIDIMHHNRDREKLIETISSFIVGIMNKDIALALFYFNNYYEYITPKDETQIVIENYKNYIDPEIAESDKSCIYNIEDTRAVISYLLNDIDITSVINNPILKSWLNDRGVSDEQIIRHKLIDLTHLWSYDTFMQNCSGATIHPALRNWIAKDKTSNWIPDGIMTPVFNLDNEIVGCHNRFLSTVPQIKFASSIPNFHLFTNLRKGMKVNKIIIVEGVFDALAIDFISNDRIGWIAPSTGFWTEEQLIYLIYTLQHFPDTEVISCFDNDRVGLKSNILLTYTLNKIGINTKIMNFTEGKDPAEAIHKYKLTLEDLKEKTLKDASVQYKSMPHEPFKKFEDYMDNRHTSYSTENYRWK